MCRYNQESPFKNQRYAQFMLFTLIYCIFGHLQGQKRGWININAELSGWQIIILLMQSNFNPEQTANDIRAKSFLKSRDPQRDTNGSVFFKDNKIRSCSYIKETPGALKAVPFYDKRDNTLYPTPSHIKQSWNASTYAKPNTVFAGMGTSKPLHAYDPKDDRNNLGIPDFRPPYPNSSKIQIGQRSNRDVKHYVTNYGNSFINKPVYVPTNHPGIEAFRNKWVRSRLAK